MDFMTKYPNPDLSFIRALASGDICFSDEQVTQYTLLFEELKRSSKVKVKAEPVKREPAAEESGSAKAEASLGAHEDVFDDESKDVELVLSFTSENQMQFASKYATSVHRAIMLRRQGDPSDSSC